MCGVVPASWQVRAHCHVAVNILGMHVLEGDPSPEEERTCYNVATTTPLPECSQVVRSCRGEATAAALAAFAIADSLPCSMSRTIQILLNALPSRRPFQSLILPQSLH